MKALVAKIKNSQEQRHEVTGGGGGEGLEGMVEEKKRDTREGRRRRW